MARFQDKLKDFIKEKLSSNPTWQKVEILLSGHDVCESNCGVQVEMYYSLIRPFQYWMLKYDLGLV